MGKSILTERRWPYQVHAPITVAANGLITVPASSPQVTFFKVKQLVTLTLAGQESRDYRIRAVLSDTEIYLGPVDNPFRVIEKPIQFSGGTLSIMEQERNQMTWDVIGRAIYEEEPTVALRNVLVDWRGHFYDLDNPLPVQLSDGNISIGTVNAEVEVQLSHKPDTPHPGDVPDSVQIGDGVDILQINPDGSINVDSVGIIESTHNVAVSVPSGSETLITSLTHAAPLFKRKLQRVEFTGENIAKYVVYHNGNPIATRRTHHGSGLTGEFVWGASGNSGLILYLGDTVEVKVEHDRPALGNFEARIQTIKA